jgi:haloalkane dehalogenase
MAESLVDFVRTWNAQREVTVRGLHFLQEDSPHEIGRAIADWLASIDADGSTTERSGVER